MISDFDLAGKNKIQKAFYYLKYYGMAYTLKKALRKLGVAFDEESEYMAWCKRTAATRQERKAQENSGISGQLSFVIVSKEGTDFGRAGFRRQTCKRVSFAQLKEGGTLRELLKAHDGDAFVFCGENVRAMPEYLFEATKAFCGYKKEPASRIRPENKREVDLVYTDEDNCVGKERSRPFFKPDESPQLLLDFPYLGACFAVRRSLLEKIVKEEADLLLCPDGFYGLSLQAFRLAGHVFHIPKVLFSNLVSETEKGAFIHSQNPVNECCLREYLKAERIPAKILKSDVPGFFHVKKELEKEPLISIIIPNKDHIEDLRLCLSSLAQNSNYTNYEVIIAENNSEDPKTFSFYEELKRSDFRIRTVVWEGGFNYSAINNFAAGQANGELFLFLNNDTEFMDADSLRELALSVLKPGVGACGAMLYYGDKTIQHAGVIIGMGGFAAHALWSLTDRDERYYPFSLCEREVSAVTGACLMVRRDVFEMVGGMEEEFVVALNDVDFCMKVRAAGYRILFNPYARLYHYESKSRGYEDTAEKQARFQKEINRFQKKWENEIKAQDPYYNPNLTLHRADYSMDI